jgi:hypothetical protein
LIHPFQFIHEFGFFRTAHAFPAFHLNFVPLLLRHHLTRSLDLLLLLLLLSLLFLLFFFAAPQHLLAELFESRYFFGLGEYEFLLPLPGLRNGVHLILAQLEMSQFLSVARNGGIVALGHRRRITTRPFLIDMLRGGHSPRARVERRREDVSDVRDRELVIAFSVPSVHRDSLALLPLLVDCVILRLQHLLDALTGLLDMLQGAFLFRLEHLDAIVQLLHVILDAHTVVTCLFFRKHP